MPYITTKHGEQLNPAMTVLQIDRLYAAAESLEQRAYAARPGTPDRDRLRHAARFARAQARELSDAIGSTGQG